MATFVFSIRLRCPSSVSLMPTVISRSVPYTFTKKKNRWSRFLMKEIALFGMHRKWLFCRWSGTVTTYQRLRTSHQRDSTNNQELYFWQQPTFSDSSLMTTKKPKFRSISSSLLLQTTLSRWRQQWIRQVHSEIRILKQLKLKPRRPKALKIRISKANRLKILNSS